MFLKPFRIKSNVACKGSEKKKLKQDLLAIYPRLCKQDLEELMPAKSLLSIIRLVTYGGVVVTTYHCEDQPIFFDHESVICPSVYTLWKCQRMLSSIVIIQQSLSRLQNGADLMLPGVVEPEDGGISVLGLKEGQYCSLRIKGQDIYGLGRCLISGEQMVRNGMRGKCLKILHLHGDLLWEMGPMTTPLDDMVHTRVYYPGHGDPPDLETKEKGKYRSSRENKEHDPYFQDFRDATIAVYHAKTRAQVIEREKREAITRALEQRKIYMEGLPPPEVNKEGRIFGRGAFDSLLENPDNYSAMTTPRTLLEDIVNDLDEVGVSVPESYGGGDSEATRETMPLSRETTPTSNDSWKEDRNISTSEEEKEREGFREQGVWSDDEGVWSHLNPEDGDVASGGVAVPSGMQEEEFGDDIDVSIPQKYAGSKSKATPTNPEENGEGLVGVQHKHSKDSVLQKWISKEGSEGSESKEGSEGSEFDEIGISLPQEYQSGSCDSSEKGEESEGEEASSSRGEEHEEATPKSWYSIPLKHGATSVHKRDEDTVSSHDMDELLKECFMTAIKSMGSKVKGTAGPLPLLTSTFYRSIMAPLCPVRMKLDVKKSSYKKFSRFLLEMQSEGVVKLGETDKGSEVITSVDFKHPLVKSFSPRILPSVDVATKISNEATPLQISSLYMPSQRLVTFFRQLGFTKASIMNYQQVRESVMKYIKDNDLISSEDPKQVLPDPVLGDALYRKGGNPHKGILRQELLKMIIEEMKPAYSIKYGSAPAVIKRGKLDPVKLTLAQRMGNKKVTLIDNLEVYGIPANDLAQSMQKLAASSTTVYDVPGRPSSQQVMVQGNAIKVVAKVLQDSYGLPIKHIEAVDKVKPTKPKKKRKK